MDQDWLDRDTFRDIMGSFLDIRRVGTDRYVTHCPFHKERTPSFTVFLQNMRYYCFGCGDSGDVIKFLMNFKNWTFVQAIDYLRNDWGLDIPGKEDKGTEYGKILERIHSVYVGNLSRYNVTFFKNLGFEGEDLKHGEAGYADERVNAMILRDWGTETLLRMGLLNESRNFVISNRITFPLRNKRGSIVAFQGRTLFKNSSHKYLTNRNNQFFHKSKYMYGLNLIEGRNIKDLILVEGIKDAIKMQVLGFNTVSTLGSKVSEYQLDLLNDYLDKADNYLYVMFDGDNAGEMGTEGLIELMRRKKYLYLLKRTMVCTLEVDQDPASICSLPGSARFFIEKVLYQSVPAYQWLRDRRKDRRIKFKNMTPHQEVQHFFDQHLVYVPVPALRFLRKAGINVRRWTELPDFSTVHLIRKLVTLLVLQGFKNDLFNRIVDRQGIRLANDLTNAMDRIRREMVSQVNDLD